MIIIINYNPRRAAGEKFRHAAARAFRREKKLIRVRIRSRRRRRRRRRRWLVGWLIYRYFNSIKFSGIREIQS